MPSDSCVWCKTMVDQNVFNSISFGLYYIPHKAKKKKKEKKLS